MALTDTRVRALKARERVYTAADGRGLYLEVFPTGGKVWRLRYRLNGKQEKVTIGKYPDVSLAEARDRALDYRRDVAKGISVAGEKRARRDAEQLPEVLKPFSEAWLASLADRSASYLDEIRRVLKHDVWPQLGGKRLADITAGDVLAVTDRIKARGATMVARNARNYLKRMFDFAIARQKVLHNPAAAVAARYIAEPKARTRALGRDEIKDFLRAVYRSNARRSTKLAAHLLLITMVRKGELIGARWSQIDLARGEWEIPDTKSKRPHVVYLSDQARCMFEELVELACGSEYVFPRRDTLDRHMAETTLNGLFYATGFPDLRPHDFRRTASTLLHEAGFASDVIERALNHSIPGVRGVYNRAQYADQRRVMLQQWADMIDAWLADRRVITGTFGGREKAAG